MFADHPQTRSGWRSSESATGPLRRRIAEGRISLLRLAWSRFPPFPRRGQIFPLQFFALYPQCLNGTVDAALSSGYLLYFNFSGLSGPGLIGFEQVIKQVPIVGHCLPEVFRRGLVASVMLGNRLGGPVALHCPGMIYRQIGYPPLIASRRIATRLHHFTHQKFSVCNRLSRLINKAGLNPLPGIGEPIDLFSRKRTNLERFSSLFAVCQF